MTGIVPAMTALRLFEAAKPQTGAAVLRRLRRCYAAAFFFAEVGTDAIVFRICEAIW